MDTDELEASSRRDSEGVNQRISDLDAHLGERIDLVDKRIEQVDKRSELASFLRGFEQRLFDHVQSVQTELGHRIDAAQTETGRRIDAAQTEMGRRIDAVQQFRLQGLALVVALTATSAIVGTFALQLFGTF